MEGNRDDDDEIGGRKRKLYRRIVFDDEETDDENEDEKPKKARRAESGRADSTSADDNQNLTPAIIDLHASEAASTSTGRAVRLQPESSTKITSSHVEKYKVVKSQSSSESSKDSSTSNDENLPDSVTQHLTTGKPEKIGESIDYESLPKPNPRLGGSSESSSISDEDKRLSTSSESSTSDEEKKMSTNFDEKVTLESPKKGNEASSEDSRESVLSGVQPNTDTGSQPTAIAEVSQSGSISATLSSSATQSSEIQARTPEGVPNTEEENADNTDKNEQSEEMETDNASSAQSDFNNQINNAVIKEEKVEEIILEKELLSINPETVIDNEKTEVEFMDTNEAYDPHKVIKSEMAVREKRMVEMDPVKRFDIKECRVIIERIKNVDVITILDSPKRTTELSEITVKIPNATQQTAIKNSDLLLTEAVAGPSGVNTSSALDFSLMNASMNDLRKLQIECDRAMAEKLTMMDSSEIEINPNINKPLFQTMNINLSIMENDSEEELEEKSRTENSIQYKSENRDEWSLNNSIAPNNELLADDNDSNMSADTIIEQKENEEIEIIEGIAKLAVWRTLPAQEGSRTVNNTDPSTIISSVKTSDQALPEGGIKFVKRNPFGTTSHKRAAYVTPSPTMDELCLQLGLVNIEERIQQRVEHREKRQFKTEGIGTKWLSELEIKDYLMRYEKLSEEEANRKVEKLGFKIKLIKREGRNPQFLSLDDWPRDRVYQTMGVEYPIENKDGEVIDYKVVPSHFQLDYFGPKYCYGDMLIDRSSLMIASRTTGLHDMWSVWCSDRQCPYKQNIVRDALFCTGHNYNCPVHIYCDIDFKRHYGFDMRTDIYKIQPGFLLCVKCSYDICKTCDDEHKLIPKVMTFNREAPIHHNGSRTQKAHENKADWSYLERYLDYGLPTSKVIYFKERSESQQLVNQMENLSLDIKKLPTIKFEQIKEMFTPGTPKNGNSRLNREVKSLTSDPFYKSINSAEMPKRASITMRRHQPKSDKKLKKPSFSYNDKLNEALYSYSEQLGVAFPSDLEEFSENGCTLALQDIDNRKYKPRDSINILFGPEETANELMIWFNEDKSEMGKIINTSQAERKADEKLLRKLIFKDDYNDVNKELELGLAILRRGGVRSDLTHELMSCFRDTHREAVIALYCMLKTFFEKLDDESKQEANKIYRQHLIQLKNDFARKIYPQTIPRAEISARIHKAAITLSKNKMAEATPPTKSILKVSKAPPSNIQKEEDEKAFQDHGLTAQLQLRKKRRNNPKFAGKLIFELHDKTKSMPIECFLYEGETLSDLRDGFKKQMKSKDYEIYRKVLVPVYVKASEEQLKYKTKEVAESREYWAVSCIKLDNNEDVVRKTEEMLRTAPLKMENYEDV